MFIGEIIKKYREKHNLSLREFAEKADVNYSYIHKLEKVYDERTKKPFSVSYDLLKQFAIAMNIDLNSLINLLEDNQELDLIHDKSSDIVSIKYNKNHLIKMPVLGSIPAGTAIEAVEDIEEYLMIHKDRLTDGVENYFLLKIKGNSMYPKYLNEDVVLFRINPSPDSGKDCAVMVNGDDATFKQFFKYENRIELRPYNRDYEIQVFTPEEVINLPIRVIGEAESLEYRNLN